MGSSATVRLATPNAQDTAAERGPQRRGGIRNPPPGEFQAAVLQQVGSHGLSVVEMEGDLIKHERVYWDGATLPAGARVLG
jgi:hypothetical protein